MGPQLRPRGAHPPPHVSAPATRSCPLGGGRALHCGGSNAWLALRPPKQLCLIVGKPSHAQRS